MPRRDRTRKCSLQFSSPATPTRTARFGHVAPSMAHAFAVPEPPVAVHHHTSACSCLRCSHCSSHSLFVASHQRADQGGTGLPRQLVLNAADKAKLAVANLDPGATLTSLASPSAKVGLLSDEVVAPVQTVAVACHVVEHQARGLLHCHRHLFKYILK